MDRRLDVLVAGMAIVFGLVLAFIAQGLRDSPTLQDPLRSRGMPTLLGVCIVVGATGLVLRRVRGWRQQRSHDVPPEGRPDEEGHPASVVRVVGIWGALVWYAVFLPPLGYLVATPLAMAACLWAMRFRSVPRVAMISVGLPVAVYVLFDVLLGMPLPGGILSGVLQYLPHGIRV